MRSRACGGPIPWANSISPGLPLAGQNWRPDQSRAGAEPGLAKGQDHAVIGRWPPGGRSVSLQVARLRVWGVGLTETTRPPPVFDLGSTQRKSQHLFKGLDRLRCSPERAEGRTSSMLIKATDSAPPSIPEGAAFLPLVPPRPSVQPSPLVPPSLLVLPPSLATGPALVHHPGLRPSVQPPLTAQSLHTDSLTTLGGGDRDCSRTGSCGPWGLLSWTLGGWRSEWPSILRADARPASHPLPLLHGAPGPPLTATLPSPPPAPLRPARAPSLLAARPHVGRVKTLLLSRKHPSPDTPLLLLLSLALKLLLGSQQVQVQVP